jgi:hypothetical protein
MCVRWGYIHTASRMWVAEVANACWPEAEAMQDSVMHLCDTKHNSCTIGVREAPMWLCACDNSFGLEGISRLGWVQAEPGGSS